MISLIAIIFSKVLASVYIEYRFNQNFGTTYWDFSGNGFKGKITDPTTAFSTDRGLYFNKINSYVGPTAVNITLPQKFTILTWINPTNSQNRLLKVVVSNNCRFHLGRISSNSAVYIELDDTGNYTSYGPSNSFPSGQWALASLLYDGSKFQAMINGVIQVTITHTFVCSNVGSWMGVGAPDNTQFTAVNGFIWNYVMLDDVTSINNYISLSTSSTCLLGAGTCTSCSSSIIDPNLGTGCLPTNPDSSQNTEGIPCSLLSVGCTLTVVLNCTALYMNCLYNQVANQCYFQSKTTGATTIATCLCQSGYLSVNNQCCGSDCASCDFKGICLTCFDGFYLNGGSCLACGTGCKTCVSVQSCQVCFDSNAGASGGICSCNLGYFASSSVVCTACGLGCMSCSNISPCLSCFDLNSVVSLSSCVCKEGFYNITTVTTYGSCLQCHLDCLTCDSPNTCLTCQDSNASPSIIGCSCNNGYYSSNGICVKCPNQCSTCDSISCLTCIASNSSPTANFDCACSPGFYNTTLLLTSSSCLPCPSQCETCSSSSCTSCISLNAVPNKNYGCTCSSGYYNISLLITQSSCLPCMSLCKTCNLFNQCTSCAVSSILPDINGLCQCGPGFYFNGLDSCLPCDPACGTCSSPLSCDSCKIPNSSPVNNSNTCECDQFFYSNSSDCLPCSSSCQTCDNSFTCISCKAGNRFLPYCEPCHFSCLTCSGEKMYQCTSCEFLLLQGVCSYTCPVGFQAESKVCVADLTSPAMRFKFEDTGNVFYDSIHGIPAFINNNGKSGRGLAVFHVNRRGAYFTGSACLEVERNSKLLSLDFGFSVWVKPEKNSSVILSKLRLADRVAFFTIFYESIFRCEVLIEENMYVYRPELQVELYEWNHIYVSIKYNLISMYVNGIQGNSEVFSSTPFVDSDESLLIIGSGNNYSHSLKGFIYQLEVFNSYTCINSLVSVSGCDSCLFCLASGECISSCSQNEFFSNLTKSCQPCPDLCKNGCVDSKNCRFCSDPNCLFCSRFDFSICEVCSFNFELVGNVCRPCPGSSFYDSQIRSCVKCPEFCTSCDSSVRCIACAENRVLDSRGLCSCKEEFFLDKRCE